MITTDAEYSAAIKGLLDDLNMRLTTPGWMPIAADEQARFIHVILGRAHEIVNSEPFARGKVVDTVNKVKELDMESAEKDSEAYREVANLLYNALSLCRGLSKSDRATRKQALEAAEKIL